LQSDRPSSNPPSDRPIYDADERALAPGYPQREMYAGDTLVLDLQVMRPPRGSPSGTPAQPLDLTGWTIYFAAKRTFADPDTQAVSFLSNTAGGITFTDVLNGKLEIVMPPTATRGFPIGVTRLVYTVKGIDPSGVASTIEVGTLDVWPSGVAAIS